MKIENQVVSFELSKQLKEAGYEQEGIFKWAKYRKFWEIKKQEWSVSINPNPQNNPNIIEYLVAPTVSELGERLPKGTCFVKRNKRWSCSIPCSYIPQIADTIANVGAKTLIAYLKIKK